MPASSSQCRWFSRPAQRNTRRRPLWIYWHDTCSVRVFLLESRSSPWFGYRRWYEAPLKGGEASGLLMKVACRIRDPGHLFCVRLAGFFYLNWRRNANQRCGGDLHSPYVSDKILDLGHHPSNKFFFLIPPTSLDWVSDPELCPFYWILFVCLLFSLAHLYHLDQASLRAWHLCVDLFRICKNYDKLLIKNSINYKRF